MLATQPMARRWASKRRGHSIHKDVKDAKEDARISGSMVATTMATMPQRRGSKAYSEPQLSLRLGAKQQALLHVDALAQK
mmetsp:Transcript_4423/g.10767  ORF Transcript_4423/g.10767 Transcript_4423/m.10767 type:complete len:80 (-) Transcript_4423:102-341(-)